MNKYIATILLSLSTVSTYTMQQHTFDVGVAINNMLDDNNRISLHYAARYGNTKIVKLLIEAGAHVNAKDSNGNTPLFYSVTSIGDSEVMQALINAGGEVNTQDNQGRTPLHVAAQYGNTKITRVR